MKVSKVLGHATAEDVNQERSTDYLKKGNDEADEAAGRGQNLHPDLMRIMTPFLVTRQKAYLDFMIKPFDVMQQFHAQVLKRNPATTSEVAADLCGCPVPVVWRDPDSGQHRPYD